MVVLLIDKAIRYRFFSDLGDLCIIVAGKRIMYIYIYINLQNVFHRPNTSLKQQIIDDRCAELFVYPHEVSNVFMLGAELYLLNDFSKCV